MRLLSATVVIVASLAARSAHAQQQEDVPALRQASILTRALAFDRNLKERAGDNLIVGVIYRAGNAVSEASSTELLQSFQRLEKFAVHGLPFKAVRVPFDSIDSLRATIRNDGIDAIYICSGLDNEVDSLAALAQERKITTMGAREEYVTRALAIGIFVVDSKPTILLNWGESKKEGASFSDDLVKFAKVINDKDK